MPEKETQIKTAVVKFEAVQCWRCQKSNIECECEKNPLSLKNRHAEWEKSGNAKLQMHKPNPPEILFHLLSRACSRLGVHQNAEVTIYHWLWLDLHLDCGVWGAGSNAWYEWFVMEKLPDGSYQLETSEMGYGSTPYCLKTVLQKMDGRGWL